MKRDPSNLNKKFAKCVIRRYAQAMFLAGPRILKVNLFA
jgi:hypothetical protein